MPLPIAHSLLGASLITLFYPQNTKRLWIPLGIGAFLANAADFDFALVFLLGSKEWHRGFSHSILFGVIVLLTMLLATKFSQIKESIAFGIAFASHLVLDFVTTKYGGKGVELFWFFSSERYKLNWFGLSEMPSNLSFSEILIAILFEFILFAPIFLLAVYLRENYLQTNRPSAS
ncbi:MAG TPA: metal-dependent hydrolase [Pyrinomonadaceae bacterium]|nr:metal-dependent hydrolase [Pyrinomonadaceae bacterium]